MFYILWFLIAFAIVGAGYWYAGWRLLGGAHLDPPWNWIAWAALGVLVLLPVGIMVLTVNRIDFPFKRGVEWAAYISLGFFSLLITLLIVRDASWLLVIAVRKSIALVSGTSQSATEEGGLMDPARRDALLQTMNIGILALAGGLASYGFYEARRKPSIAEVFVPVNDLPTALEGFRIVQITDLHAGLTVARPFVETVVEMANGLGGDLVAFTGDLVDGSVGELRFDVEPMKNLRAPLGKYFITGNHEYYSGALPWVAEAKRLGFDVLLNEHRVIRQGTSTIVLAGVTDITGGQFIPEHRSDPHKAIAGAPPADVKILLAHQPRSVYEGAKAGFDVQISGHTHGGQFFPWNLLAAVGQPFIKGLHRYQDTWVYVSKGTGYWGPPVRLGARSEITVITLVRARGNAGRNAGES